LNVLFFGTPQFAVPTLERLLESSHRVVAVVTQPDKPAGRGRKLTPPAVKDAALAHGLTVLQPESVRTDEFAAELAKYNADVAVVVAYGKILPKRILTTPRHGCLNVHASILPKYRGAAPIQWALINGESTTGVTIMQMDEGMDTGPIIEIVEVEILEDDDAISVAAMLSLTGAASMVDILDRLERDGRLESTPQDHSQASKAPLIKRDMALLDWSDSAEKIILAIRGFQPWPKAYTHNDGKELKILGADGCSPDWVSTAAFEDAVPTGTVVDVFKGRGFVVRAGGEKGLVLVTRVQPEGRAEMTADDFVNGGGVDIGTRLGT